MYLEIVLTHLLFGIVLGVVMHRSDFCMAGAFRDIFLTRDYFRMRAVILLVSVTSALLYLARVSGLVSSYPPSFYSSPSLAHLAGGVIFGIGMVLAGGCVVGTLYKAGAGNLVSVCALAGLLPGSLLFAWAYPLYRSFVEATTLPGGYTALEHVTGSPGLPVFAIASLSLFFLFKGRGHGKWTGNAYAKGYLDPWKAALIVCAVIILSFILSGRPLALTAGYTKLAACMAEKVLPGLGQSMAADRDDSVRLLYGKIMDPRNLSEPDPVSITQIPLFIGILAGAFLSALKLGELSAGPVPPGRQLVSGFAGGILIAGGSLMAGGCNVWHIMGGLPLFVFQSILFVCGMAFGAYVGSRLLLTTVLQVERCDPYGNHSY